MVQEAGPVSAVLESSRAFEEATRLERKTTAQIQDKGRSFCKRKSTRGCQSNRAEGRAAAVCQSFLFSAPEGHSCHADTAYRAR